MAERTSKPSRKKVTFETLPRELRDDIYELAVVEDIKLSHGPDRSPKSGCFFDASADFKALRLTSRQICKEVEEVYLEQNRFAVWMPSKEGDEIYLHRGHSCRCEPALSQMKHLTLYYDGALPWPDLLVTLSTNTSDASGRDIELRWDFMRGFDEQVDGVMEQVKAKAERSIKAILVSQEMPGLATYGSIEKIRDCIRKEFQKEFSEAEMSDTSSPEDRQVQGGSDELFFGDGL